MRRQRLLLVVLSLVVGCATPVGVRRVDERTVQRTLTANVLSTGQPSAASRQVLQTLGLDRTFARDPEAALAELHQRALEEMLPDRLFALAEYSFLHAERRNERDYFVAASVYAFAFLFPEDGSEPPGKFDPRVRTAVDLYNRALARTLVSDEGEVAGSQGRYPVPFGVLELELDSRGLDWADRRLGNFVPAAELAVRGLRNRHRRAGIGAPFVAEALSVPGRTLDVRSARVVDGVKVPVTFVLRYEDARAGLRSDDDAILRRRLDRIPSSVDNMDPDSPFIRTLSSIPVDPGVHVHSIIAVRGGPPPEGQNDGVVGFEAARIEGAESEFVVFHSGHSPQSDPLAIQEVRRILLHGVDN